MSKKGRLWVHETPVFEVIFTTLTENSSIITNDTKGPQNIHITGYNCSSTIHTQHDTKTTLVFLPVDGETSCLLLPSYYHAARCNQKTTIPVSRWQVRSQEVKIEEASFLIIASKSVHLLTSVSTILTSQIQLKPTQKKKMGCEAGRCNKTSTP